LEPEFGKSRLPRSTTSVAQIGAEKTAVKKRQRMGTIWRAEFILCSSSDVALVRLLVSAGGSWFSQLSESPPSRSDGWRFDVGVSPEVQILLEQLYGSLGIAPFRLQLAELEESDSRADGLLVRKIRFRTNKSLIGLDCRIEISFGCS
jgi:hypothetical protein